MRFERRMDVILVLNGWLLEDLNVVEVGGKRAINIVLSVGLNEVLKRREDEVQTAKSWSF